jgi:hypothetical protein
MEEKLHVFLNSELNEGTGNRHAWAAVQLQKYTSVPNGLEVDVSQDRSESFGEQTSLPIPNIEQRSIDRRLRSLARISGRLLRRLLWNSHRQMFCKMSRFGKNWGVWTQCEVEVTNRK